MPSSKPPFSVHKQVTKTAGTTDAVLAAIIGAAVAGAGTNIPLIERIRLSNPTLYAALVGASTMMTAQALQNQREQVPVDLQPAAFAGGLPLMGALRLPGYAV